MYPRRHARAPGTEFQNLSLANTFEELQYRVVHEFDESHKGVVARVRGNPPLLQSSMDILWRLRFSRLRHAPARKA